MSALIVRASRNLPEAKEEAWHALYVDQSVPAGLVLGTLIQALLAARPARGADALHGSATSRRSPASPAAACSRCSA